MSFSYFKGPLIKIFQTDATYGCIISFIWQYMKMTRRLPFFGDFYNAGQLIKARERCTFFQLKVYERGTFPVKMVYKRVKGWTSGRASPYTDLCRVLARGISSTNNLPLSCPRKHTAV